MMTWLFGFFICGLLTLSVKAQFPTICVSNATGVSSKVCCPRHPENYQVCGGYQRGSCQPIQTATYPVPVLSVNDDRINWPLRFFTYACKCRRNFFGPACEECWYGWTGPNCDRRHVTIRRDIRSLSSNERIILRDLLVLADTEPSGYSVLIERDPSHSDPIWNPQWEVASIRYHLVALHRYTSRTTFFDTEDLCLKRRETMNTNHNCFGFVTWHRYFVMHWERLLGRVAQQKYGIKNFAFPFWDWVGRDTCDVCTNDLFGAPGEIDERGDQRLDKGSPFYDFTEYCGQPSRLGIRRSCYGCHTALPFRKLVRKINPSEPLPSVEQVKFVMSLSDYYLPNELNDLKNCRSFHLALEGSCSNQTGKTWMHNAVHNRVDGSFCCASTAANDPIFSAHHSQVDRLLHAWMVKYNADESVFPNETPGNPGQCKYCNIIGYFPVLQHIDMMKPADQLGYEFEHLEFGGDYPPYNG